MAHKGVIHNLHNAMGGIAGSPVVRTTSGIDGLIEDGRFFGSAFVLEGVASSTTEYALIIVPVDVSIELIAVIYCTATAIISTHVNPTITNNGTPRMISGFNTTSPNTTTVQIYSGPTVSDPGTRISQLLLPGGVGIQSVGGSVVPTRLILGPGMYLASVRHKSNQTEDIGFRFNWVERPQ